MFPLTRVQRKSRWTSTPTKGLSKLNSMAFGLAVYASQCGLPTPHARLASGRWSGATGRAFHPQGSYERFQICFLHLIPLSQASWRNFIDRAQGDVGEDVAGLLPKVFNHGQHRFDESAAVGALRAEGQFSPDHRVAQRSFPGLVRRLNALPDGRLTRLAEMQCV